MLFIKLASYSGQHSFITYSCYYSLVCIQSRNMEGYCRMTISLSKVMAVFSASLYNYAIHIFSLTIILLWLYISIAIKISVRHTHRSSVIDIWLQHS